MTTYIEFAFVGTVIVLGAIFLGPVSFNHSDVSIQQVQAEVPSYAPADNSGVQKSKEQIIDGIFVDYAAPAVKTFEI